jgi:putative ABC transport system permease protein
MYEVVGVVADTKYSGLRDASPPIVYAPVTQQPAGERWPWALVAMRTSAPIAVLKPALERVVASAGLRSDVVVWPLARQIREGLLRERLMSWLSSVFAALALLLAALGIYGVVAYGVSRRGPEIAIRMALGASAHDVRRLLLRQTASVVAVGLVLGALGALAAGRAANALLFGLTPYDPLTLAAAAATLAAVGLAAAWVPAARASRTSPLEGLRAE